MDVTTLPPGLEGSNLVEVSSGGGKDWMHLKTRKMYTNAFLVCEDKILLGYKKRGFGKSRYNGFGGKVNPGESTAEAAVRELKEEAGIEAPLRHCGTLLFTCEGIEWAFQIEIYYADEYSGEIIETDEMRPEWFTLPLVSPAEGLPLDQMWESDRFWLPLLLAKERFVGRTDFGLEGDVHKLKKWWFGISERSPI